MRVLVLTLMLVAGMASATTSFAGNKGDSKFLDHPHIEAQALYAKATTLQQQAKHKEALPLLKKALKLHKRPDIAAALGESEASLQDYVAAAEHLTYAMGLLPPHSADSKKATAAMKRVRKHVTEVRWVVVPPDAIVLLDGERIDHTKDMFVLSGEHKLMAERAGRATLEETRMLRTNGMETVKLVLPKLGDARPNTKGDPAELWPWIAGVGGTLTIGAIVAGAVLTSVANDHDERAGQLLDSLPPFDAVQGACFGGNATICDELVTERESKDSTQDAATGMWVTAGMLGASTILGVVLSTQLDSSDANEPVSAMVAPMVGPGVGGLQLRGRW